MEDPKETATNLMRESRGLLEQAKKYRDELQDLEEDDPHRERLEAIIRDLIGRATSMSKAAKRIVSSQEASPP